jgi:hypothetical protein
MISRETLRRMCEYEYAPSLVGEAILDFQDVEVKETAEQRAHRRWRMVHAEENGKWRLE